MRDTVCPVNVTWPDRRADVIVGLEALAAAPPMLDGSQLNPQWPDLTNAVHWVVDDTWWDRQDPAGSVGSILRDETEATTIRAVVELILRVSERQGPTAPDTSWFADPEWPLVRQRALVASELMHENDHL